MKLAIDYILGGNYAKTILKAHPKGWGAGFLWNVSWVRGSKKIIDKLAATGAENVPFIRVSLIWHDSHTFKNRDARRTKKRCKQLTKIIEKYPEIEWLVQPMLEPHGASPELTNKILKAARLNLPKGVKLVSGNQFGGPNVLHEGHHRGYSDQQIFSFDGLHCMNQDVSYWKERARQAEYFFLWRAECNGNKPGEKKPRWNRQHWLTRAELREMVRKFK
jgi:hypothetical protein